MSLDDCLRKSARSKLRRLDNDDDSKSAPNFESKHNRFSILASDEVCYTFANEFYDQCILECCEVSIP